MHSLLGFIRRVYYYTVLCVRWLLGAATKTSGLPPVVYQIVHLLLVAIIIGLLAFFSRDLPGGENVDSESPFVRDYYYGIVGFLVYVFVRLLLYVIRLFRIQEEAEFPDIDEAWQAGLKGMSQERFDLQSLPIILVLGLSEQEETSFFAGARLNPTLIAPGVDRKGSPLRFFASEDALFITCPGVFTVNRQLSYRPSAPAAQSRPFGGGDSDGTQAPMMSAPQSAEATLQPGAYMPGAAAAGQTLQPGQVPGMGGMGGAMGTLQPGQVAAASGSGAAPVTSTLSNYDLDLCQRRLHYVCRLIARERVPYCPINGGLLIVPLAVADAAPDAVATALREDLRALHDFLEMLFPLAVVFSGLDQNAGVQDFVQRASKVDPRFTDRLRAGSHYSAGHPITFEAADWVIARGVEWFRRWIYSSFAQDPSASSNTKLYRLLCNLDARRERLAHFLTSALGDAVRGDTVRLVGCYFSGSDPATRRHIFVKDVLFKLLDEQDDVAWSWSRVRRDQTCRTWTYAVVGLIVALVAADLWLAWSYWKPF